MNSKLLKKLILVNLIVVVSIVTVIILKKYSTPKDVATINVAQKTETQTIVAQSNPQDVSSSLGISNKVVVTATNPPATVVPDNRCIVTVSGNRYDVTSYRNSHSGGNIFTCGVDMTSVFKSQHSSGTLKQMSPYLIK
jgi:cytochrome b involved in lipid metabolism